MYFEKKTVCFSEAGPDYRIKLTKILDYFQDTCTNQAERTSISARELRKRGFGWVLSSWQVVVNRYPELGEQVLVGTAPYEFKGFMGYRNFVMKTEAGEILAYANSIWSFLDVDKMMLTRLPEDVLKHYEIGEKLDMDYAPRKIHLPENMSVCEPVKVLYHNLDPNNHVNNAQYVAVAEDIVPEGRSCRQVRVEYRASAHSGDYLFPHVYKDAENGIAIVSLADKDANPYVIVEFKE